MAAVSVATGRNLGLAYPNSPGTVVRQYIAAVALAQGNVVYCDTAGKAALATSAAANAAAQFIGIVMPPGGAAGEAVSVVEQGEVDGFDLSGVAYAGKVYLGTGGALADAAGTVTVPVGRVRAKTDKPTLTKHLVVCANRTADWA